MYSKKRSRTIAIVFSRTFGSGSVSVSQNRPRKRTDEKKRFFFSFSSTERKRTDPARWLYKSYYHWNSFDLERTQVPIYCCYFYFIFLNVPSESVCQVCGCVCVLLKLRTLQTWNCEIRFYLYIFSNWFFLLFSLLFVCNLDTTKLSK